MGKGHRTVAIVFGSAGAFLCVVATVGYFGLRQLGSGLRAQGVVVEHEADEFAKGRAAPECVDEALARQAREATFMGGVKAKAFLHGCLSKARPVAGFCDGVPRYGEILASAQWAVGTCAQHGMPGNETCGRTVQSIIEFCSGK
jgi:hypothetical protein